MRNTYLSATARRFVKRTAQVRYEVGQGVWGGRSGHKTSPPFFVTGSLRALRGRGERRLRKVRNLAPFLLVRCSVSLRHSDATNARYMHNAYVVALQRRGRDYLYDMGEAKIDAIGKGKGFSPGSCTMHNAQRTTHNGTMHINQAMARPPIFVGDSLWKGPFVYIRRINPVS